MSEMKIARNEWKFLLTEGEAAEFLNRFSGVLPFDEHHPEDGTYMIRSLYFDDERDSCLKDNLAGNPRRYKYRVRYYNNAADELHLERKEKNLDRCGKHTCRLSREEYEALCAGDVSAIHYENEPLLRDFCAAVLMRRFTPKVIVEYERTAFVDPTTNIRVTIDRAVNCSDDCAAFTEGGYNSYPVLQGDARVLEVKFDAILPGYIRRVLDTGSYRQTAFSKYARGRAALSAILA